MLKGEGSAEDGEGASLRGGWGGGGCREAPAIAGGSVALDVAEAVCKGRTAGMGASVASEGVGMPGVSSSPSASISPSASASTLVASPSAVVVSRTLSPDSSLTDGVTASS